MKCFNHTVIFPGAENLFLRNLNICSQRDGSGTLSLDFYKNDSTDWIVNWMSLVSRTFFDTKVREYTSNTTHNLLRRRVDIFVHSTIYNPSIVAQHHLYDVLPIEIRYYDDFSGICTAVFSYNFCRTEYL